MSMLSGPFPEGGGYVGEVYKWPPEGQLSPVVPGWVECQDPDASRQRGPLLPCAHAVSEHRACLGEHLPPFFLFCSSSASFWISSISFSSSS